uniref:uncharacterized protein LOC122584294 n=1 Tax=Erigeron canadensis TaxID=72917 RepID=UPI001CB9A3B4|nr:uncharacterized protein LOC122584294 [Erigeron canadensis]
MVHLLKEKMLGKPVSGVQLVKLTTVDHVWRKLEDAIGVKDDTPKAKASAYQMISVEDELDDEGAIGALDGTLVHAIVPASEQTAYRGRGGGRCYQNVLGVFDFNMIITFVWAGWEGIAHDSRVLTEVVYNPSSGFPFPQPNEYYLCDAAYANTRGFLAPYRNTRYWLADFRRRRPLTEEEKFNHAHAHAHTHAQLRNVIERAYGVLKERFPILEQMAPYKFSTQRNVVIACFAINNFIRKYKIQDELFLESDEHTSVNNAAQPVENAEEGMGGTQWGSQSTQYMTNFRDEIANQIVTNTSI